MKVLFVALALLASSYARALNSGIFGDDGEALGRFAGSDSGVARRADGLGLTATPTKRDTNADRLRRHLPLLPPKRRTGLRMSHRYKMARGY